MKGLLRDIQKIYNPIELVLIIPFLFLLNYLYFYITTENVFISILIGVVGLAFFFYHFSYKTRRLNNYQQQLSDLLKYVNNVKFFLGIGENVLHALMSTVPTITNKQVRKDIQKTIDRLKDDVELDTSHFEKYEFPSLNQFHQNLAICYEYGGNVKEMFDPIQKNIMLELQKRDELYKRRKGFALSFYTLIAIILAIPVLMRYMVDDLWGIFLDYTIPSIGILLFNYFACLFFLYKVQKHKMDISVRI